MTPCEIAFLAGITLGFIFGAGMVICLWDAKKEILNEFDRLISKIKDE